MFFRTGKPQSPPPERVAAVMVTTPLVTVPPKVTPHVIGAPADEGDVTTMVPALVVKGPAGVIVAALAIEAAPKHRASEVAQTRVFKLFIIFPHMLWRVIRQG
ncbi:hypothetical protein C8K66_11889 [Pseudomonas sp. GV105]|nr:hypothetical protein C8K66_11889 [Pseudomonas sp. GV105]